MIMAQDEGRFGRIDYPRRCWAPKPIRPTVPRQIVREFVYVFAAVGAQWGRLTALILPTANTEMMSLFLIPSCILKSNSHIGEVGQGTDAVGISSELGEACAERVLQSIKGRERLVGQDLLPQFFPDMLGWIEFRTAGRLGQ